MATLPFAVRALYLVYSLVIELVVWIVLVPATWMRARPTDDEATRLRHHLGRAPARVSSRLPAPGAVLVHAVSVGEMHAAAPLVAALTGKAQRVFLTAGTAAGLEAAHRLALANPAVDGVAWLPWDRRAVRGWLARLAPAAVVVVETEIWPNLFRACADLRVPLLIANGRVRPRDVTRYRLMPGFFRHILECAAWIGVQSPAERERFLAIGAPAARIEIAGNLKFDAAAMSAAGASPDPSAPGDRPRVVAGSTHDPEERWLLECARLLEGEGRPVQLVLAPRDIARARRVARLARSDGFRAQLSSDSSSAEWDVLVLDRYGALRASYRGADIVVMGGTFAPIGGHNILEPAVLARPIVIGPHTEEIAATVEPFAIARALMRVPAVEPAHAIASACKVLLDDRRLAREMGERAAEVCRQWTGSAARHAAVIVERLAANA